MSLDVETKPVWTTEREAMGKTYEIGLWADDVGLTKGQGSDFAGTMNHRKHRIAVNANSPPSAREETLLHEIIHRVSAELLATELKEGQVRTLSNGIFAFLRGFGLWQDFPWPDRQKEE